MESKPSPQPARQSDPYMRDPKSRERSPETFEPNPWRDNHGNLLLGFTAILCLIGGSIIACQQAKFYPPGFPKVIQQPSDAVDSLAAGDASGAAGSDNPLVRPVPLKIYGAASDEGMMKIALYVQAEGFNDSQQAFEVDSWKIVNGVCSGIWEIPVELKQVAFAAYHDTNANDELDRNALGIPSERYGYSNNARGITGPPTFAEAAITVADDPIEISIR